MAKKKRKTNTDAELDKIVSDFLQLAGAVSQNGYVRLRDDKPAPYSGMLTNNLYTDYNLVYKDNIVGSSIQEQLDMLINATPRLRKDEVSDEDVAKLIAEAEEYGQNWIYENCGKHDILDLGEDWVCERALDAIAGWLEDMVEDEYDFPLLEMYEVLVEGIMSRISLDFALPIIEEIMDAPVTISEKLKDIGMSERDFM